MEAEHKVQLKLLRVLQDSLARPAEDPVRCGTLMRQLADYSEAHFLSEQLVMRQHAYPGYEQHVQEHDRLLDEIRGLVAAWGRGEASVASSVAWRLEEWLLAHMRTTDHSLFIYLGGVAGSPA